MIEAGSTEGKDHEPEKTWTGRGARMLVSVDLERERDGSDVRVRGRAID